MKKFSAINKLSCLAIAAYLLIGSINSFGQKYEQLEKFNREKKVVKLILNNKGIPNFIEGNLNPADIKGNKEEQTIRFFEENKGIFNINVKGNINLVSLNLNDTIWGNWAVPASAIVPRGTRTWLLAKLVALSTSPSSVALATPANAIPVGIVSVKVIF